MLNQKLSCSKWSTIIVALVMTAAFCVQVFAQSAPAVHVGNAQIKGVPEDWTHHHVVFANPGTEQEAISAGRHERWVKTVNDPRYVMQQMRRNLPIQGPAATDAAYRAMWISHAFGHDSVIPRLPEAGGPSSGLKDRDPLPVRLKRKGRGLSDAIKQDWNETLGSTTSPNAPTFPAKWSFSTSTASCSSDFVVYPTAADAGDASVIAYYNLYSGCGGTVPEVAWAYATGGTVPLSPVLSLDGSQIAFIQVSSEDVASLVLLKLPATLPGTGTLIAPATPSTAADNIAYFNNGIGCTAPCMYSIALNGNPNDTWSNPFYDYANDSLYVGDSAGQLHKFNPVFRGAPAEVVSAGVWPVQLARGATIDTGQVASPVYDNVSGYVFVGTTLANLGSSSGYLYAVGSGNQGTTSGSINGYSTQIDGTWGVRDAPLLDSAAGELYVFAGNDLSGNNGVFQFATNFGAATAGNEVILSSTGVDGMNSYQFAGTFDNAYYTASNSSSPSGNLYACGSKDEAPLYQIAITSNAMGTVTTGPTVDNSGFYGRCSPVTEFYNSNAGVDYLFVSVYDGYPAGCNNTPDVQGCVLSYDVTNSSNFTPSLSPDGEFNVSVSQSSYYAPTGGIIVDNNVPSGTLVGASQIYFLTQDTSGDSPCTGICAVQLSQSGLAQ
jgi:hypothetical protein